MSEISKVKINNDGNYGIKDTYGRDAIDKVDERVTEIERKIEAGEIGGGGGSSVDFAIAAGEGENSIIANSISGEFENHAIGANSFAMGVGTTASEGYIENLHDDNYDIGPFPAYAEGFQSLATGAASHAEGYQTYVQYGPGHAEGYQTSALGEEYIETINSLYGYGDTTTPTYNYYYYPSHAEGCNTVSQYWGSHAEGAYTSALGNVTHAEGYLTLVSGDHAHAEGESTTASGQRAHAEGYLTLVSGDHAHAEGESTIAGGAGSHAEGQDTYASGDCSHAEGQSTTAENIASHAEGINNYAGTVDMRYGSKVYHRTAHAEGYGTYAYVNTSSYDRYSYEYGNGLRNGTAHAEGNNTRAIGPNTHAEGFMTYAHVPHPTSQYEAQHGNFGGAHAEGWTTTAIGSGSHSEGIWGRALKEGAHAEGYNTFATEYYSHAEGSQTTADGSAAHSEGDRTLAGQYAHAEGVLTTATGNGNHSEGYFTRAQGSYGSHSEGYYTTAYGGGAHAENNKTYARITSEYYDTAHAEGMECSAIGDSNATFNATHAEGYKTYAYTVYTGASYGHSAHAEGSLTTALRLNAHAEGYKTYAASPAYAGTSLGDYATHAEGIGSSSTGPASHAANYYTIAQGKYQTAIGKYNIADENDEYALIIGNGTSATRSNALTVDWEGNIIASGDIITKDGVVPSTTSVINTITDPDNYPIASAATYSLRSVPQKTEFKKIYMADHGYSLYGDIIDDNTMHKVVLEASGLDDNPYNIFEIKAPSNNAGESTLALMCSDSEIINFTDFSLMKYDSVVQTDGKPVQEIVMQSRGDSELPHFHMCFNNGSSGRVKKFSVHPDAIPMELTAEGLKIRKNNNFDNSSIASDYEIIDLIALKNSMINSYDIDLGETFTVIEGEISYLHYWDFTKSSIDSITGESAILTNCNTSSNGLVIDSPNDNCKLGAVFNVGNTLEIEIANTDASFDTSTHGSFIMIYSSSSNMSEGLVWRHQTQSWAFYVDGSWDSDLPITDRNYFSGKTLKLVSDERGYLSLYVDDEFIAKTNLAFDSSHNNVSIGGYANSFTNATITSVKIYNKEA